MSVDKNFSYTDKAIKYYEKKGSPDEEYDRSEQEEEPKEYQPPVSSKRGRKKRVAEENE